MCPTIITNCYNITNIPTYEGIDADAVHTLAKNFCDRREQKFFGWTARCEKKTRYMILFLTNFEQNCHQNTKQDSGKISNFGFRFRNRSLFRNQKLISRIEASYSSRISFRDIKIRILRPRFGRNLAPWIFLRPKSWFCIRSWPRYGV